MAVVDMIVVVVGSSTIGLVLASIVVVESWLAFVEESMAVVAVDSFMLGSVVGGSLRGGLAGVSFRVGSGSGLLVTNV